MTTQDETPLADDLLPGARAIATFLGLRERQARHQIDRGVIPVRRIGGLIVASKKVLRRCFIPSEADIEAAIAIAKRLSRSASTVRPSINETGSDEAA
jgi:hypothetical protein